MEDHIAFSIIDGCQTKLSLFQLFKVILTVNYFTDNMSELDYGQKSYYP